MTGDAEFRVLVCGGREFGDLETAERRKLRSELDQILREHPEMILCHGAALGADSLVGDWALSRNVRCVQYPANWDRYGKRAGPIRNAYMLDDFQPHMVVAFPGGRGTLHMTTIARQHGVFVYEPYATYVVQELL